TQAFSGRYDRVDVSAHDLKRRTMRLDSLDVVVHGAHVPLRAAISGRVNAVPVESLSATGVIAFDDLAQKTDLAEASIVPAGDKVDVTARVHVLGEDLVVTA